MLVLSLLQSLYNLACRKQCCLGQATSAMLLGRDVHAWRCHIGGLSPCNSIEIHSSF